MKNIYRYPFTFLILISLSACFGDGTNPPPPTPQSDTTLTEKIHIPTFNGDSAYSFVQQQVDFGPRVPGTVEHTACSEWIRTTLEDFGWQVQFQDAQINGPDNQPMPMRNIIATYKPEQDERILLCAHWDSRAMADQDTERRDQAILGADDGGSGVGVLMEIARLVANNPLDLGLEIVLFDVEDQGESNTPRPSEQTWCLGAQFWSRNPHAMAVVPRFGILLDMVGSLGAQFPQEGISVNRAGGTVALVWNKALELGYSGIFINEQDDEMVDDHLFVNDIAGIPTIDIINRPIAHNNGVPIKNASGRHQRTFGSYWHTHNDNMSVINKNTLRIVGDVLTHVLYSEAAS